MMSNPYRPAFASRLARVSSAAAGCACAALMELALIASGALAQGGIWTPFSVPGVGATSVAPADSGGVLCATPFGAYQFDGQRLRKLPIFSPIGDSLSGQAIMRARNGDLWLGTTAQGLYRLAPDGTVARFTKTDGIGNSSTDEVIALAETPDGRVWAGTQGGGLSVYDGLTWTTITTDVGLPTMNVAALTVDPRDGSVWAGCLGSTGGLAHVVGASVTAYSGLSSTAQNVSAVLVTRAGAVWVGFDEGIAQLVGSSFVETRVPQAQIRAIAEDAHGVLWCGSRTRGVGFYDHGVLKFFASGPASNTVDRLFVADSGVLWVATTSGVSRFEGAAWLTYRSLDPLPDGSRVFSTVRDLSAAARGDSIDGNGVTWFGMANTPDPLNPLKLGRRANERLSFFGTANGLPPGTIYVLAPAGAGGVWAGTATASSGSVARVLVDGTVTSVISAAQGLPAAPVTALQAQGTNLWIGTTRGVAHWDGTSVRLLPTGASRVPDATIVGLDVDAAGRLWIATGLNPLDPTDPRPGVGAVLFDPSDSSYTSFATAQGLPSDRLHSVRVAPNGDVWFGTHGGVGLRRAGAIYPFTAGQGLPSNVVNAVMGDDRGMAWAATAAGLAVLDGPDISSYTVADGLAANLTLGLWLDSLGVIVPCASDGISFFHPDRTPPRSRIVAGPPRVSGNATPSFVVAGGDPDAGTRDLRLAYQFDGRTRTPFLTDLSAISPTSPTFGLPLADGEHSLKLWAKDRALNETPVPFEVKFIVDATAPRPVLQSPAFDDVVQGTVPVVGLIADLRFARYTVEIRHAGAIAWDTLLVADALPTPADTVYRWDTTVQNDGAWELRVGVLDSLGLQGYATVSVIVDNLLPSASVTSPARVDHVQGGRVFTTNGEAELYVPPNAWPIDQRVRIDPLVPPDTLAARGWLAAWLVSAPDVTLDKPATLTLRRPAVLTAGGPIVETSPAFPPLSILRRLSDGTLVRIGGSTSADGQVATTAIDSLGAFVLLEGATYGAGATFAGVRDLDCQPRVVSPKGGGFDTRVAISFELAKTTNAAVKVFDRAGRLVREVVEREPFLPGRNVVFWDGRDGDGAVVPSGLYMVAVRAEGETAVKTVAVANR